MLTKSLIASLKGGSFLWTVASSLAPGINYALRIEQGDDVNFSGQFTIVGGQAASTATPTQTTPTPAQPQPQPRPLHQNLRPHPSRFRIQSILRILRRTCLPLHLHHKRRNQVMQRPHLRLQSVNHRTAQLYLPVGLLHRPRYRHLEVVVQVKVV